MKQGSAVEIAATTGGMYTNTKAKKNKKKTKTNKKFDRFEQWLRQNGAKFEQLELRSYDCQEEECLTTTAGAGNTATAAAAAAAVVAQDVPTANDTASEEKKEPNHTFIYHQQQEEDDNDDDDDADSDNYADDEDNAEESEMRGVHAKSTIPPNTICMSIPLRCLITVEMGQATEIGQLIYKSNLDLDAPKHIYLMIYVLWDRKINGKQSFFYPYYTILPKSLHNMPIFWNDDELHELTGSYLLQQIQDRKRAIYDDYVAICSVVPYFPQIASLSEFEWARMCVCSRNFGLCIHGHRTSALVPHADMLNHYRPRETKWTYDEMIQSFTITTLQQSIPAGHEVLDSYGQKCNHRFLLNYGFAMEDNVEMDGFCPNEVPIELLLHIHDPIFFEKLDFWVRGSSHHHHSTSSTTGNAVQYSARPQQQQQHHSSIDSNHNKSNATTTAKANINHHNTNTLETASREQIVQSTMKRIRICVTNNDNTRLLFSLLRIIVATPSEFYHSVLLLPTTTTTKPSSTTATSSSSSRSDLSNDFSTQQQQQRQQQQQQQQQRQQYMSSFTINNIHRNTLPSSATTSSTDVLHFLGQQQQQRYQHSYNHHRTCRDVRYPINLRNERAAMQLLHSLLQQLLSQYLTTLEQDIIDLQNLVHYPKYSNRRHAKIQVRGEKIVLHHYLKWSQIAIDILNVIEYEIHQEMEKYRLNHTTSSIQQGEQQMQPSVPQGIEVRWNDGGMINDLNDHQGTTMDSISQQHHQQLITERKTSFIDGSNYKSTILSNTTIIVDDNANSYYQNHNDMEYTTVNDSCHHHTQINPGTGTANATISNRKTYNMMIRELEHEMMNDDTDDDVYIETTHDVHYTILRYCIDVLGYVRNEELRRAVQEHEQQQEYAQEQQHHLSRRSSTSKTAAATALAKIKRNQQQPYQSITPYNYRSAAVSDATTATAIMMTSTPSETTTTTTSGTTTTTTNDNISKSKNRGGSEYV